MSSFLASMDAVLADDETPACQDETADNSEALGCSTSKETVSAVAVTITTSLDTTADENSVVSSVCKAGVVSRIYAMDDIKAENDANVVNADVVQGHVCATGDGNPEHNVDLTAISKLRATADVADEMKSIDAICGFDTRQTSIIPTGNVKTLDDVSHNLCQEKVEPAAPDDASGINNLFGANSPGVGAQGDVSTKADVNIIDGLESETGCNAADELGAMANGGNAICSDNVDTVDKVNDGCVRNINPPTTLNAVNMVNTIACTNSDVDVMSVDSVNVLGNGKTIDNAAPVKSKEAIDRGTAVAVDEMDITLVDDTISAKDHNTDNVNVGGGNVMEGIDMARPDNSPEDSTVVSGFDKGDLVHFENSVGNHYEAEALSIDMLGQLYPKDSSVLLHDSNYDKKLIDAIILKLSGL